MDVFVAQMCLQTLRDLLIEEAKYLHGVSSQVEEVERDLRTIRAFLMDADRWEDNYNHATLRDWVGQLNDLATRADDVLDKYATEVASKRGGNLKQKIKRFSCLLCECVSVHEVGGEIGDIRSRFSALTGRLGSLAPAAGGPSSRQHDDDELRRTYGHEIEEYFVGMEDDMEQLVGLVKDDDRGSRVISIYGMGGLGKTTLARKLYQHKDFEFEARAWVCVTHHCQPKNVLTQLLKQFVPKGGDKIDKMEQSELVKELYELQLEKRCLIVIDDVWEADHWEMLKPAFPVASDRCKVVLTTRNRNVASQECLYELKFISEDEAWELLRRIAHPPTASGPQTEHSPLEAIGRQMVRKCGHLPLAISVIGGILRQKRTYAEWERVNENMDSYLKHGEGVGEYIKVKQILDLSYNALPYSLKSCFLYLGSFPEDEEIQAEGLYMLWIAEGMISLEDKGRAESLRDVAERYLNELALRCMVQVEKDEFSGKYKKFSSCRLHDLIRELCVSKSEEKGLIKVIDLAKHPETAPSLGTVTRLAIFYDGNLELQGHEMNRLRSFLLCHRGGASKDSEPEIFGSKGSATDLNKLRTIRLLALENGHFLLPEDIGSLIKLRYLSLFGSIVPELPLSVSSLRYLQTLDLRVNMIFDLPNNIICKLKRLRHLFLSMINVIGEDGDSLILDGLTELETLQGPITGEIRIADIPKLTSLQELDIGVQDLDSLSIIVRLMRDQVYIRLREVNISVKRCDFVSGEEGPRVFEQMVMSPVLISLSLSHCKVGSWPHYQDDMALNLVDVSVHRGEFGGDVMQDLGKLPSLKSLSLEGVEGTNTYMICLETSFPQLKSLTLYALPNLERWEVHEGAMPNLSDLEIGDCKKLEAIPEVLRDLPSLENFKCDGVPSL